MSRTFTVNLGSVVTSLSRALDLSTPAFLNHAQRVAYIALRISEYLSMDEDCRCDLLLASLLHDVGTSSLEGKRELTSFHPPLEIVASHCNRGEWLLSRTARFKHLAPIVLHHHDYWDGRNGPKGDDIPLISQIIHLADRLEVQIDRSTYILYQRPDLCEVIQGWSGVAFSPRLVKAFLELARQEAFWLDLENGHYQKYLESCGNRTTAILSMDDLEDIAELFASIIDSKSQFTKRHSIGVAERSYAIAHLLSFSGEDCALMRVSGLLHDIGKLAIPNAVLDLPSRLSTRQMLLMQQHTYWTYHLLSCLEMPNIQEWAAFHHETLDGAGYPFHVSGEQLSTGARIMAVSDVLQALIEPRPYRREMPVEKAVAILQQMGRDGKLDAEIIDVVMRNLDFVLDGAEQMAARA